MLDWGSCSVVHAPFRKHAHHHVNNNIHSHIPSSYVPTSPQVSMCNSLPQLAIWLLGRFGCGVGNLVLCILVGADVGFVPHSTSWMGCDKCRCVVGLGWGAVYVWECAAFLSWMG